ncbi:MAG: hypothetical protein JSU87_10895 [Gemmatimonadota bacterium]|nr:MAG: hypothetical protein JSU87_10895 [Gemmatimonadota bacterium]
MARESRFLLEIGGKSYGVSEAEYFGVLLNIVTTLVFEKRADRATYVLEVGESELSGAGSVHFDPISVSLYRHLKETRCHGPAYPDLKGDAQSFRLHSVLDALEAVTFFLRAGNTVPHFFVGLAEQDVLAALDRGARTRVLLQDPEIVVRLAKCLPEVSSS